MWAYYKSRALLPDLKVGDTENCGEFRRGPVTLNKQDAEKFDLNLVRMCNRAFLKSVTLSQLNAIISSRSLPVHLIPELMSWALNGHSSPSVLVALLKGWPSNSFEFNSVFNLVFTNRTLVFDSFDWITRPLTIVNHAERFEKAAIVLLQAMCNLFEEEKLGGKKLSAIEEFDLTGVDLNLRHLKLIGSGLHRNICVDLVARKSTDFCQSTYLNERLKVKRLVHQIPFKTAEDMTLLWKKLKPGQINGISISMAAIDSEMVKSGLPGIIRLEDCLTGLDLSSNLLACDQSTETLNYVLVHLKHLKRLELKCTRVSSELPNLFRNFDAKLNYLGLSGCSLHQFDLRFLRDTSCFHHLTELDIGGNKLDSTFIDFLSKLSHLQILEFESQDLRPTFVARLFKIIKARNSKLKCLCISQSPVDQWTYFELVDVIVPTLFELKAMEYAKLPHIENEGFEKDCNDNHGCRLSEDLRNVLNVYQRPDGCTKPLELHWSCNNI